MAERVYLTVGEVLAIHHQQIDNYGGAHGLRDKGCLSPPFSVSQRLQLIAVQAAGERLIIMDGGTTHHASLLQRLRSGTMKASVWH